MEDKTVLRKQDFWTALVMIAVSLFFLFQTSKIPFFKADAAGVEAGRWYNSAALVPYGIFAGLLALAIALLVNAIRQGGVPDRSVMRAVSAWVRSQAGGRMIAVSVIMLAYIFALVPRVDFIICSALVLLALIYGFHETRPRATVLALLAVLVPAGYAMIIHYPQAEWSTPHDDDWVTLGFFVLLIPTMIAELRLAGSAPDSYLRAAPVIAVLVPLILVIAMAFGFRQNVPNRTGLLFKQIEYHYYVNVKPWFAGKQ